MIISGRLNSYQMTLLISDLTKLVGMNRYEIWLEDTRGDLNLNIDPNGCIRHVAENMQAHNSCEIRVCFVALWISHHRQLWTINHSEHHAWLWTFIYHNQTLFKNLNRAHRPPLKSSHVLRQRIRCYTWGGAWSWAHVMPYILIITYSHPIDGEMLPLPTH